MRTGLRGKDKRVDASNLSADPIGAAIHRKLPSCRPRNLCKSLRKQEFAIAIVGQQLAMQHHEAFDETAKFTATPSPELLRQFRLVPKEDTPRCYFLLEKRVDVAATTYAACELRKLRGASFEGQQQPDRTEFKLLHSRQFGGKSGGISCKYSVDQGHEAIVFADCCDGIERGGVGTARRLGARIQKESQLLDFASRHPRIECGAASDSFGKLIGQVESDRIRHFPHCERYRPDVRRMEYGDEGIWPIGQEPGGPRLVGGRAGHDEDRPASDRAGKECFDRIMSLVPRAADVNLALITEQGNRSRLVREPNRIAPQVSSSELDPLELTLP